MSKREPVAADFDAVVDFYPPESMPDMVYGLIKRTFDIVADRLVPAKVEPLYCEPEYPLAPGSDFWPLKGATDVVVRGSAFAPGGKPATSQMIRVTVGRDQKLIAVYGDRAVEWLARGQLRFAPPQPYTQMPVVWSNAYGGYDPRVPIDIEPMTVAGLAQLEYNHPGVYPRNPFGKGYIVVDEPAEGISLPNLEDPQELLRPESFVTGDPRRWYVQPLPACFEFTNYMMFHRYAWLGIQPWYPPPANAALREVLLGALPTNFAELERTEIGDPFPPLAMQEAPIGMCFPSLAPGTPIIVEGMHPELAHVGFPVPPAPKIDFYLDGKVYTQPAQLTNVLVEPDKARVSLTWAARHWDLPRPFVPGIHANIPLAMLIDGTQSVRYESPVPLREQVKQGDKSRPGKPK